MNTLSNVVLTAFLVVACEDLVHSLSGVRYSNVEVLEHEYNLSVSLLLGEIDQQEALAIDGELAFHLEDIEIEDQLDRLEWKEWYGHDDIPMGWTLEDEEA